MKKFILHVILYLSGFYVLSWGATYVIEYYFLHFDKSSKTLWAATIKDQKAEIVLLGSSRMANMIDSKLLGELTTKSILNLGTSGAGYAENFLILNEYMKNNKVAECVVLNVDEMCLSMDIFKYAQGFKHFDLFPLFYNQDVNSIYKKVSTPQRYYTWYAIPLLPYIEFNERLGLYGVYSNISNNNKAYDFNVLTGDKLLEDNKFSDTTSIKARSLEIDSISEYYFYQIIDLCESKGAKVVLVVAPMLNKGRNAKLDVYLNQIYQKKGVQCFDFSCDKRLNSQVLFYDRIHTNASGSIAYTRLLGERLNSSDLLVR